MLPPHSSASPRDPGARPQGAAIAWLPTLLAKGPARLARQHLRHPVLPERAARLHCIVLDTSGSMRQRGRLASAKGHVDALLEQAARQGDDVAVLRFGGQGVELLVPPGPARRAARARLRPLGGGGGTPLALALDEADRLLGRAARAWPGPAGVRPVQRWLWLLSDGRTLEQARAPRAAQRVVIVDFDDPRQSVGRCAAWAAAWGATHLRPFEVVPAASGWPLAPAAA